MIFLLYSDTFNGFDGDSKYAARPPSESVTV